MTDSMVVPGRAWCVEASMGHCVIWDPPGGPLLPGRHFDGRAYAGELVDLLRWGLELGINGMDILHGERGGLADPGGPLLEEEAARRGVPFAVGGHVGHGFPHWMPAGLLTARPEHCRLDPQGQRRTTGNLCTAQPEALGRAVGELTLLLDRHPGARLLQVFPDDVLGGSWCHCPRCRGRSAAEQYATLVAAVAGACAARRPGTQVGYLLYHDTLAGLPDPATASAAGLVPPSVYGLFAPRERCYAHAIDDPACPRNRAYWAHLLRARQTFGGRLDVFEYYGDTILWHYFNVAIPHVIARDLRAYARLGAREVQALAFGAYSRWAHGLNLAVFGWLASGAETDVDAAVARYAAEWFGPQAAGAMVAYYGALEGAQAPYLAFCGYGEEWMGDLRGMATPTPEYGPHRQRVAASRAAFAELDAPLAAAAAACRSPLHAARVAAEQSSLCITRLELELLELRLAAAERLGDAQSQPAQPAAAPGASLTSAARTGATRRRQWDLAAEVPVEIRGQAFAALAP